MKEFGIITTAIIVFLGLPVALGMMYLGSNDQYEFPLGSLIVFGIGAVVYFLPCTIAFKRDHHQAAPILIINLFLGWTLIGWVGALAWAATPVKVVE